MEGSPTAPDPPSTATAATHNSTSNAALPITSTSDTTSSSFSVHEDSDVYTVSTTTTKRPGMRAQRSSGTIIVPREHPKVELNDEDEEFDDDDARAMSPRRSSQEMEKMSQDARAELDKHAKVLQKSLLEIFNRIEAVKEEHDKLDNNNKFLQKYIGDLMSTSKITSTGASGRKK
ncbi:uncharacterized protein BP5553_07664 [Venustampulla echinocandica]|uniref:BZIP transcription factor n=1 Tax=Venustampulla echinocandica TaxID=2656787 RepID=A0A370TH61_9HELO|nr:uncharacterized protein BP5553_07664 [Venustampulla echinocandica]RDL34536.1 hypothetical protein BP5553_07664 [Venustampulla echinocandica]